MTAASGASAGSGERLAALVPGELLDSYGVVTVDVEADRWVAALRLARDEVGLAFFDWLSAVDELDAGLLVVCHLVDPAGHGHVLIRTRIPADAPVLPTATEVFRGAAWHERETHEMFGIDFTGHVGLRPLLLPDGFEGRPLRKDFALAARVARPWPGAKEPRAAPAPPSAGGVAP